MISNAPLILASASPRRQQLLQHFDIPFEVKVADVDESVLENEKPGSLTVRLSKLKAQTVFASCPDNCRVLGGDTTVALGHQVMGKPESRDHAISMLRELSGRTHRVFSAVALVDTGGTRSLLSETLVTFKKLSDNVIAQYCDTDDPYDKAGAYGIQSSAAGFVNQLQGSYSGVIGLPLWHTHQLLMDLV